MDLVSNNAADLEIYPLAIAAGEILETCTVELFKNDVTPNREMELADFTLAVVQVDLEQHQDFLLALRQALGVGNRVNQRIQRVNTLRVRAFYQSIKVYFRFRNRPQSMPSCNNHGYPSRTITAPSLCASRLASRWDA